MYDSALKLGLCNNLEGWEKGRGKRLVQEGGAYVHLWLIHVDVWQKSNQYCKAIIFQFKKNFKKNSNKKYSFHHLLLLLLSSHILQIKVNYS